jgi:alpha-glucosidase (family GH31 glycosyl hydrolase)
MSPHLVYRTIGGILDIFFFPGPNPEDVVQQYLAIIGRPFLPAYWALGFQQSRWGYANLDAMKTVIQRTIDNQIPLDVAYVDIDYMDHYRDFTIGAVC